VLFLTFAGLVTAIVYRLGARPEWWPPYLLGLVWVGSLVSAWCAFTGNITRPDRLGFAAAGYLWGLTALLATLGERELVDLKRYLADAERNHQEVHLSYANLSRNIWSEWGYLSLWLGRDVRGLHTEAQLKEALLRKDTILIQNRMGQYEEFQAFVRKQMPGYVYETIPWTRWRTHGESESGKPLWLEAWNKRSFAPLEAKYFIIAPKS
jgi:hypothetical protein